MELLDITAVLKPSTINSFCFNPSIIHLEKDIYLVSYRIARYFYEEKIGAHHNPWRTWDNCYKFFSNPTKVARSKYKPPASLAAAFSISLDSLEYQWSVLNVDEYDSTSLALIRYDGRGAATLLANIEKPFGEAMNQDARLIRRAADDDCGRYSATIIYNVYYSDGSVVLLRRDFSLDLEAKMLYFGAEMPLFNHVYKKIEKNCVPAGARVLYSVGPSKVKIIDGARILEAPSLFAPLENILYSCSTPLVQYSEMRLISCAHIKILYKKETLQPELKAFVARFANKIHLHGKYIYVACLFELDEKSGEMTRCSDMFIPSIMASHLPYALIMPTGLTEAPCGRFILSYGEGDCKCILLSLSREDIERMLAPRPLSARAFFLTHSLKVRHIGYFGAHNTGDDAFVTVFKYLKDKYYPYAALEFLSPEEAAAAVAAPSNITILGGGDVISPYFVERAAADIAVGVGVPYQEYMQYSARFRYIITRNRDDVAAMGSSRAEYFPDLCFLLPEIIEHPIAGGRHLIGVSVLRTYFDARFPSLYQEYIQATATWIAAVARQEPQVSFLLIPFGINPRKPRENDKLTCSDIIAAVGDAACISMAAVTLQNNVREVYDAVRSVSFMVCARFHSHIFSAAARIPFVSLTCGRKCLEFMKQTGLEDYCYKLPSNEADLPEGLDGAAMGAFIAEKYRARANIPLVDYKYEMKQFEKRYMELVREMARGGETLLA